MHTDASRSSKEPSVSKDSRITISGRPDGKKCVFECWLPDNNYCCQQTAVKFSSATRVGPTLSEMRWKQNLVHSSRYLVGDVSISDANGVETADRTSPAPQSINQMTKSTGSGQPLIHTRFSVHSRSYNSRPWKDISSRSSSSSTSSYCSVVVARDMQKYITCENTRCETIKPARRFSLFRTNSRRKTVRLRPDGNVRCSSLSSDSSREARFTKLQFNLKGKGSRFNPVDTLPMYHRNSVKTNIQEAIAHIVTETLQAGNDVGEEINMPEELHAMKTEHTNQAHSNSECLVNKLWNSIPPSGVEQNLSVVKLRQMAGKLIEGLICKIKLQLDAGIHPLTGELECETNENKAHKHAECQRCNGTNEHAARSKSATNDYKHPKEDGSEIKLESRQATEKHLAKEQALTAEDHGKILVSLENMQPIIYRSTNKKNDDMKDQQYGPPNMPEFSTKSARSGKALLSLRTFDFETDRCTEGKQSMQENRGAHNDKSSQTSSINTASDYEESSIDDDEEKEETGSDINPQTRCYHSINDVISDMRVERQQQLGRCDQLINNSNNDYVERKEVVKYHSVRSQPLDPPSESEPSTSSSTGEEYEPVPLAPSGSLSIQSEYGSRLTVPGVSPSNIREPKDMSSVPSSSSSTKKESEPMSSLPSSISSVGKGSEPMSSVPSSSLSIKKESEPTPSVPSSASSVKKESELTPSVPSSSSSIKKESERTSSVPSSSSSIKRASKATSSVPSSSTSRKKESEPRSSVPSSSLSMRKKSHHHLLPTSPAPSSAPFRRKASEPKSEVVYSNWEAKVGNNSVRGKDLAATSSHSNLSTMEDLNEAIDHVTMTAEAEATLKSFATEVVQSLYTAIRFKLKHLVEDCKDEEKKQEIMRRGDTELRNQILPTIIEHIVWIIKEEFRGQDEAKWKQAMIHDPGQYLDTIVTNAVMKTHADHIRHRKFLKTFVVTSNFRQSAEWKL